jgi:phosphoribosyl 1,2-cyclic phosphodiesterase
MVRRRLHRKTDWLRLTVEGSFKLGRLGIEVYPTPHDAAEPIAFRFRRGRLSFSHVTDIGHISRSVEELLEGSQVVLVESNHDVEMLRRGPYPDSLKHRVGSPSGHLSNEALARYLEKRLPQSCQQLILAHLSRTNNHVSLALASARGALDRRGGLLPTIHLAHQHRPTRLLRISEPRQVSENEGQGVLAF